MERRMWVRFSGSLPEQQSKHGPHTEVKIQKPPLFPSSSDPTPLLPHLPTRPHLPFTLCALTSLPMRVIGISKRWPEGHTASPRKPNWRKSWSTAQQGWESPQLYIHTCTFFHSRSLLASFLYFKGCSSPPEKETETSSIQTSLPPPPTHLPTFFPSSFFDTHFSISSFWSSHRFFTFSFSFTFIFHILYLFIFFEPADINPSALGFLASDYSIEHLTDIFTKSLLIQKNKYIIFIRLMKKWS